MRMDLRTRHPCRGRGGALFVLKNRQAAARPLRRGRQAMQLPERKLRETDGPSTGVASNNIENRTPRDAHHPDAHPQAQAQTTARSETVV